MNFCQHCGERRSREGLQFCTACGGALEVDAAPGFQPVFQPTYQPAPQPEYVQPGPLPGTPAGRGGRGLGRGVVAGAGAMALALVGGGVLVWQLTSSGGAGSPEEAVDNFVHAIVEQDGVGLLETVVPGEVDGLDDVYRAAHDRAKDEGFVEGSGISDAFTLEVADVTYDVDELGEDFARVTIDSGTVTATYDPDLLPEGLQQLAEEQPRKEVTNNDLEDLFDEGTSGEFGLVTVRVDGGWYVSLLGTYADLFYQEVKQSSEGFVDVSEPDYDAVNDDVEPIVGDTPEEVVDNLVDALNDADAEDLLANFPADVGPGLRPYASMLSDLWRDVGYEADLRVDRLDLDSEEVGNYLKVRINEAIFASEYGGFGVDSECLVDVDMDGNVVESVCLPSDVTDAGIDSFYVLMREVDGGYQIDPIATVASYATTAIDELPTQVFEDLLD